MNDGKPFANHSWVPVFDGDLAKHNTLGVGWVQVGDDSKSTGKNYKEAFGSDCSWGEASIVQLEILFL